jgi:NADPH-dependent 7-cyano-7-deazaguanine reductase QueF
VIETKPCDADVIVTVTSDLEHRCPYRNEHDHGRVTIVYRIDGQALELHSLRAWLGGFREATASHEEVTDRIRLDLSAMPGIELLSVVSEWTTARMEVSCSTSPIPVGQL